MNEPGALVLGAAVLLPLLGAVLVATLGRWPNLREAASFVTSGALFAVVLGILQRHLAGEHVWHTVGMLTVACVLACWHCRSYDHIVKKLSLVQENEK